MYSLHEEPSSICISFVCCFFLVFFFLICKRSPHKSEKTKGVKNCAHHYGYDAPVSWKLFVFRLVSRILSMACLVQVCSSAHPVLPGLAWAPLEFCPLQNSPCTWYTVTNTKNSAFLYPFSVLLRAELAVFPGYSRLCVLWLPEAF